MSDDAGGEDADKAERVEQPRQAEQPEPASQPADLPAAVERWELSGGTWRVQSVSDDKAVVELLRCDGGEIAELATLTDPNDLLWSGVQLAAWAGRANAADSDELRNSTAPTDPDREEYE